MNIKEHYFWMISFLFILKSTKAMIGEIYFFLKIFLFINSTLQRRRLFATQRLVR